MTPVLNLLRPRHCNSYGSYFNDSQPAESEQIPGLMADKATRSSDGDQEAVDKINKGGEVATSSKVDGDDSYEGWLQLGIGGDYRSSYSNRQDPSTLDPSSSNSRDHKGDPVELDLFFHRRSANPRPTVPAPLPHAGSPTLAPLFPTVMGGYCHQWPDDPSWSTAARTFALGRFACQPASLSSSVWLDREMRVVSRPRRPQMGVWLLLQAAQNQVKEPFLPQIPKSYLRIKDGIRMTIRLLMKYLANKLALEDESQVEITCRGQQLPPFLTLIYVRDNIWCSPEAVELHSDSSSTKYVMNLHYSRSRSR